MQLTLRQVADLFAVSENTVTRWIKVSNLPASDIKSQYRFDRAELLEWAVTNQKSFSPSVFQEINGDHSTEFSLADALDRSGPTLHVFGNDRQEVLRNAISDLPLPKSFSSDNLLELMMAREKSGGTAIGNGIAIPHPRFPVVLDNGEAVVRACYLDHPLEFHASDGKLVDTMFLMICPTVHSHLQLLCRLASVLKNDDFRKLLQSRPDKNQLVSAVRAEEHSFAENRNPG